MKGQSEYNLLHSWKFDFSASLSTIIDHYQLLIYFWAMPERKHIFSGTFPTFFFSAHLYNAVAPMTIVGLPEKREEYGWDPLDFLKDASIKLILRLNL